MKRWLAVLALLAGCGTADPVWWVRSAGADMPVWVRGNVESGKLLLFLHGGPGENSLNNTERPVFQALEREMGVVYWDQRASGSSRGNATPDTLSLDQMVADLDLVVETLRLRYPGKRVVLLGYSWGGAVGTSYLADPARQAKIAGWIDLDGSSDIPEGNRLAREAMLAKTQEKVAAGDQAPRWQAVHDWYAATPTIELASFPQHLQYVGAMEDELVKTVQAVGAGSIGLNFFSPFVGLSRLMNQGYITRAFVLTPAFLETNLTPQQPKLTLPALVLWGRQDMRLPLGLGQQVYDKLGTPAARKQLIVIDDAAHGAFVEAPDAFRSAVSGFVAGL